MQRKMNDRVAVARHGALYTGIGVPSTELRVDSPDGYGWRRSVEWKTLPDADAHRVLWM